MSFLKNGNLLYKIMKNVLFVIPHPDDEIVGSCILIKNFLKKQKVTLVFVTNGVVSPNMNWFWKRKSYKKGCKKIRLKTIQSSKRNNYDGS